MILTISNRCIACPMDLQTKSTYPHVGIGLGFDESKLVPKLETHKSILPPIGVLAIVQVLRESGKWLLNQ